ncbi:MAG: sortase [Candidatus Dojkabacteria bacterium]
MKKLLNNMPIARHKASQAEDANSAFKRKKRRKIRGLIMINSALVILLILITSVYGKLMVQEIRYSFARVFDEDVKNSKKYYEGLPKDVKASQGIVLEPVVDIPEPKNRQFSIIIPKLDINENVVPEVDINNPDQVKEALKDGVGWAKGTVPPGNNGNSLIFSHSTVNSWEILRYNAVFTLMRHMEINDMFTIVYEDRQYDFLVFERKIVAANDTSYLTSAADGRVVTLQTCHPPGMDTNRLLVRGRLVAMEVK